MLVPGLHADNHLAECAIRPLVVIRTVSGGSCSAAGTKTRLALAGLLPLTARRTPQLGQKSRHGAMHQAMDGARHRLPGVLLDDLGNGQIGPWNQPWPSADAGLTGSECLAHDLNMHVDKPSVTHNRGPHWAHAATIATRRTI